MESGHDLKTGWVKMHLPLNKLNYRHCKSVRFSSGGLGQMPSRPRFWDILSLKTHLEESYSQNVYNVMYKKFDNF